VGQDGTILLGATDRYFCALRPDGSVRWSYPASVKTDCGDPYVSPAIGRDGTIYFGANSANGSNYVLYAFGNAHTLHD